MDNQLSELKIRVFLDVLSAFRPGYSIQYVLMNLVEKWKSDLDTSKSSGTLLMDLSKAFDCIPHDLLLIKLKAYGVEEVSLTLIASYLRNRKQSVKICGYCSAWLPLSKGVPQGSISGPSIFDFFINDFCWLFEELLANYADDSNLSVIRDKVQEVKAVLKN